MARSISKICNISKDKFFISLQLIFNSSFFSFDNIIYRQKFGMPMGSPLIHPISPVCEFSITRFGALEALNTLAFYISFYVHYINDIAMGTPAKKNINIISFQFISSSITVHDWNWWWQIKLFRYYYYQKQLIFLNMIGITSLLSLIGIWISFLSILFRKKEVGIIGPFCYLNLNKIVKRTWSLFIETL